MTGHTREVYHAIKGKFNEIIGEMTHDEVRKFKGEREKLAGHLAQKFNIDFESAKREASRLILAERNQQDTMSS